MKKLGVIIPYRNMPHALSTFVPIIRRFLAKNKITYNIYVIEQAAGKQFNRGKLINAGYDLFKAEFDYFCTHDTDLLPMISDYSYPSKTTILSHVRNHIVYPVEYMGGVVTFIKEEFEAINGFSNEYWGWGEEDNDIFDRIYKKKIPINVLENGCYYHIDHDKRDISNIKVSNKRLKDMKEGKIDPSKDGLSNLDYKKHRITNECGYKIVTVAI